MYRGHWKERIDGGSGSENGRDAKKVTGTPSGMKVGQEHGRTLKKNTGHREVLEACFQVGQKPGGTKVKAAGKKNGNSTIQGRITRLGESI